MEATLFATLMSILNGGAFVGSALGSGLTAAFGVTATDFTRLVPLILVTPALLIHETIEHVAKRRGTGRAVVDLALYARCLIVAAIVEHLFARTDVPCWSRELFDMGKLGAGKLV